MLSQDDKRLNHFELLAATLGLVSITLQIRQSLWYWPVSIVMTAMYIAVYIDQTLYAEMLLQIYFLLMCLYGWWSWKCGGKQKSELVVSRLSAGKWPPVLAIILLLFVTLGALMSRFTNNDAPWIDALVTAISFVATWLLARKKLENWLLWIVANLLSIGLYWHKAMYPTLVLFIVLVVLAFVGHQRWRRELECK